jgi:hypothetical protein
VLEALLKRVDGLERRLKDEKKNNASQSPVDDSGHGVDDGTNGDTTLQRPQLDTNLANLNEESAVYSPTPTRHVERLNDKERG